MNQPPDTWIAAMHSGPAAASARYCDFGIAHFHYSATAKETDDFRFSSDAVSTSGIILGSWPAFGS
jgi:hypothetical protein